MDSAGWCKSTSETAFTLNSRPECSELNKKSLCVLDKKSGGMKKKKEDRRVERTLQLLHEALMGLILEKGYEAITVQDILDRANLGRSTLYSHYQDKDALMLTGFDHLQAMIEEQHRSKITSKTGGKTLDFNLSLELFRHAQENHRLYKAMVGKQSGQMVMKATHKYLSDMMKGHLASAPKPEKKTPVPLEAGVHWTLRSFLSLLRWWLDNNMPSSPEEMDQIFRTLALSGLEKGLGLKVSWYDELSS
jgi:AcrR family transcriptional regulator